MMFSNANRDNQQGPNRIGNEPTPQQVVAPPQQGRFTTEEDAQLRAAVAQFGGSLVCNWEQVATLVPGRSARQCRERWRNYLGPERNKGPWTVEEDKLLMRKFVECGPKWVKISKSFNGRTDVDCRSRWLSLKRRAGNKSAITAPQVRRAQDVVSVTVPPQPMMMQAPQFGFQPLQQLLPDEEFFKITNTKKFDFN